MIKCILFDLGDVIVDYTDEEHYYPYLAKVSGLAIAKVRKVMEGRILWDTWNGTLSIRKFKATAAKGLGIRVSDLKWYEMQKKYARINRGTMEIVRRLNRNYSVSYLSNIDRSRYEWASELLKPYRKFFGHRFASCDIGLYKPTAAVYRYVLQRMGFNNSEVIFVDNLEENVAGARRAGIKAILFTNTKDLERKLRKMGVRL